MEKDMTQGEKKQDFWWEINIEGFFEIGLEEQKNGDVQMLSWNYPLYY